MEDFLIRAGLAGVGVAVAAGPLGCFVAWRRMAYFSDATAHAAILGVALSLGLQISIIAGVLATALGMALLVTGLTRRGQAMDTSLGVLAHSALALGLVAVSLMPNVRVDVTAYLFGDIFALRAWDVALIWIGALAVLGLLALRWSALLTATLSPELAQADGIDAARAQLVLTLTLAITVAIAIKAVGAILIGAMLIIPAATARPIVRGPEAMALMAVAIGCAMVIGGLSASLAFDTPAGPSIVALGAVLFAIVTLGDLIRSRAGV